MSQNKAIWLKNTKNGLLFLLATEDRYLYSEVLFVDATEQEIIDWENGDYWDKYNAKVEVTETITDVVSNPKTPEGDNAPEANKPLSKQNKAELLETLKALDPATELSEFNKVDEIIEAIKVFQSV